jgi:asparagine synthase (glutamine-hydrolysing)
MCGIIGIIDPAGAGAADLRRLIEILRPRGPDGEGWYQEGPVTLAMRRLAVIDVAGGNQPLYGRAGRVVAFQNGEIYNYREVRRDLEAAGAEFRTGSDTEVLAHGYALWGIEELLRRIDGMYAFAILDRDRRVLHLARDRFGEKPLFFAAAAGRFAYASNLFALAGLGWLPLEIDPGALDQYLALQYVPGPRTLFRRIERLLPGERLEVALDAPQPVRHRYYRPQLRPQEPLELARLGALVEQAVRSRLVADVPVGVFLSGGLDSSTVAALAARMHPGIDTFSIGFEDPRFDESPHAEAVARHIGSTHHALRFGKADFDLLFDRVVAALDEPLGDQAALPTYLLSREARQRVTVVLSGEGGDEIFGGYEHYLPFAPTAADARTGGGNGAALAGIRRPVDPRTPFTPAAQAHLLPALERRALTGWPGPDPEQAWERELAGWLDGAACPLQRVTAADLALALPDRLLVKVDRMSMGNSLEVRAPFLHPELVETGLGLVAGERMRRDLSKVALRRVAGSLLPAEILNRPKQVFAVPLQSWLQNRVRAAGGPLAYARAFAVPGLDADATGHLLDRAFGNAVNSNLSFSLCMLMEWHQRLIETIRSCRRSGGA